MDNVWRAGGEFVVPRSSSPARTFFPVAFTPILQEQKKHSAAFFTSRAHHSSVVAQAPFGRLCTCYDRLCYTTCHPQHMHQPAHALYELSAALQRLCHSRLDPRAFAQLPNLSPAPPAPFHLSPRSRSLSALRGPRRAMAPSPPVHPLPSGPRAQSKFFKIRAPRCYPSG
ncbi:hypothetical protein Mp_1g18850 [Marchantia polymorpha subsp. ruderalis]|uniref:Uncharacterized protein n=2 Tax=Marchantia polymorpha TaxID=3197 RepID=A0AAF6ARP6_MARPO|nr:hypothetical protein MARPO_0001s0223 [Marchantia polymorpha]BBM99116.1 hypothetical protein Mp_1g18850 [Marchantia polymorpha subsp. ruderalis]|eukprot:PTQ50194.1 hypothetical protein MARPO_0001s0223 [Marchantia polymorpha]